jgi:hypothetical protein
VALVAMLAGAGCIYDVPDVVDAGPRPDGSARDSGAPADTAVGVDSTVGFGDSGAPDAPLLEESGLQDAPSESGTEGSVGPSCVAAFRDKTKFDSTASSTITLSAPTSFAGDVMLAYVALYAGNPAPAGASLVAPAGWTSVGMTTQAGFYGGALSLYVYSKVAAAVEPVSYVFTNLVDTL